MSLLREPTDLEAALSGVPPKRVEALGLVHITVANALAGILQSGELVPSHCETFGMNLLYFSYGLPYYRPRAKQTQDDLEFPVAFVFGAERLHDVARFYPYDTGAAAKGLFGARWTSFLTRFEELYIVQSPERLVSRWYQSNTNYLQGRVRDPLSTSREPAKRLHHFLKQDLAHLGVDQRQRTIECLVDEPFSIFDALEWIAYPHTAATDIHKLWRACRPRKFRYKPYHADVNDNPAALVTLIRGMARDELKHMWEPPNGA
jgi:hypothetical protein